MKTRNIVLSGFILVKFILQYALIDPVYELHRDEFLHLDQARHLAWGYTSVPPLTSWVSWIILHLGNDVFWVKFFPALFGALTLAVAWKTVEKLNGSWFALLLCGISVVFSTLIRINMLYQPNSFDILAWTMLFYTLVRFVQSSENKWLLLTAVVFSLGFLNKYNIVFLILGLVPSVLLTDKRKILTNKYLYYSIGLAFVLILPNLIWQYLNGFPVFRHLNELARTQLVNVNRIDFVKEQFLFFFGSLFVILAAFVALVIYPPFRKYRFLGLTFFFTMLIFIYLKAKAYYAIGLYPVFLAFGSVYLEKITGEKKMKFLRPVALILPILLFLPLLQVAFPNYTPQEIRQHEERYKRFGLLRWEDGKDHDLPQDFADMLGWKELAHKTDSIIETLPDKEYTLLLCDNYGQSGAINYYSTCKNRGAVSMNADYINWFRLDRPIKNVVLVKHVFDKDPERNKEKALFESVECKGEITNPYAREKGSRIFLLRNAKADINQILRDEIAARKKQ